MFFDRLQWISGIQKSWSIFSSLNCVINGFVWTKISSWKMFFSTISQPLAWHFWSQEFFYQIKKQKQLLVYFDAMRITINVLNGLYIARWHAKHCKIKKQAIFSNRVQLLNCSKFFFLPPNEVDRSLIWVVFLWYFGNYKY
jgi:hypothetical protein